MSTVVRGLVVDIVVDFITFGGDMLVVGVFESDHLVMFEVGDVVMIGDIAADAVVSVDDPSTSAEVTEVVDSIEVSLSSGFTIAPVFINEVPEVSFEGISDESPSFEN